MYSLKLLPLSPDICYCLLNRIKQILCSHNIFEVLFLLQQVSVSAEGNIRWKITHDPLRLTWGDKDMHVGLLGIQETHWIPGHVGYPDLPGMTSIFWNWGGS